MLSRNVNSKIRAKKNSLNRFICNIFINELTKSFHFFWHEKIHKEQGVVLFFDIQFFYTFVPPPYSGTGKTLSLQSF